MSCDIFNLRKDIQVILYLKLVNSVPLTIGAAGWTSAHFLNGSMKDVRFYSDEKSQTGVNAIMAL